MMSDQKNKEKKNNQKNFWQELHQPFFCLAPMYDVTDSAFRQIITRYSAPDVVFTEFVSADGLAHPVGQKKLMHHLWFDEREQREGKTKIVAQIFGATPENFRTVAALIAERGFDGIDINMGCPQKKEIKQGVGAALINDEKRTRDIIAATIDGAGGLPVSVKTRIGFNNAEVDTWIATLLDTDISALIVHLRTKKEMSDVPAHWELMKKIVALRNDMHDDKEKSTCIPIIGNGDVQSIADARQKIADTGCNGAMLGRSIFGNPWLFHENEQKVSRDEKLRVMVEHAHLYSELFTDVKNFAMMKKHFKAYCNDFPEASALRVKLMETHNAQEVEDVIETFLKEDEEHAAQ